MNEIYSKISVLILTLTLRLCFVERIGCEVPVAVGEKVSAFLACHHRPLALVFKTHRRELALLVLHHLAEMAAM